MTNAKDYVNARQNYTAPTDVPTLEELKALLEEVIDTGKYIFVDKGYIPLNTTVASKIYNFCAAKGCYTRFDQELQNWLAEFNWKILTDFRERNYLILSAIPT